MTKPPVNHALLKPGKRLAKLLDPKAYIIIAPYDVDFPDMGNRHEVFDANGRRLAHSQTANQAWKVASIRLRQRVIAKSKEWAKGLGIAR